MRITLFIGRLAVGGGEKVLTMLANRLVNDKWEVDIVTLLGNEVEREHHHLDQRINIIDIHPMGKNPYSQNVVHWLRRIRMVIDDKRPDVIISFFGRINALVLTATIGKDIPIVVSERNDPKRDGRGRLMLKYCDLIYHRAKAIVFQTRYEQNCFSKAHLKRSYVIHNPLDIINTKSRPIEENLIVAVGRLEKQKNFPMLIKAVGIVRKRVPNVRCEIYGEGSLYNELQLGIKQEGLQNHVVLAGKKSNVLDYIAKGRAFVMTSEYEGLSNAQMEAMMLGKICVTTDYEGVEELITDGENGVVVPRNDVGKLAEVLTDILQDKVGKYDGMGEKAYEKILEFNSTKILSQWSELLKSVVHK